MRISDWSSDVCSSDLRPRRRPAVHQGCLPRFRHRHDGAFLHSLAPGERAPDHSGGRRGPPHHRRDGGNQAAAHPWSRQPEPRSEEHTSELQSLMRISSAVFCLKKKNPTTSTQIVRKHTLLNNNSLKMTRTYI